MTTVRSTLILVTLLSGGLHPVAAQRRQDATTPRRQESGATLSREALSSWQRDLPHYGKWITAAGVAAFSIVAATEHRLSRRDWNSLLTICRSASDACAVGTDGRYLRSDAEALYQRSRSYDRRANRWLVGAQVSLIATTALFIIDLHPGQGPENIPFPSQIRVGSVGGGAGVEMRLSF